MCLSGHNCLIIVCDLFECKLQYDGPLFFVRFENWKLQNFQRDNNLISILRIPLSTKDFVFFSRGILAGQNIFKVSWGRAPTNDPSLDHPCAVAKWANAHLIYFVAANATTAIIIPNNKKQISKPLAGHTTGCTTERLPNLQPLQCSISIYGGGCAPSPGSTWIMLVLSSWCGIYFESPMALAVLHKNVRSLVGNSGWISSET